MRELRHPYSVASAGAATMTVEELLREADIHTGEDLGRTIVAEVRNTLCAGAGREGLIAMMATLFDRLGEVGREEDRDAVVELLGSLASSCSPAAEL